MRHPPETLKDVFLPQGDIVQRTVDGVLLFRFSILVPSNDFQLCPLTLLAQSDHYPEIHSLTTAVGFDSHMNIPLSLAAFHVIFPPNCLDARSTKMS